MRRLGLWCRRGRAAVWRWLSEGQCLDAQGVTVRHGNGAPAVRLRTGEGRALVEMLDLHGRARVTLEVAPDANAGSLCYLTLKDQAGEIRAALLLADVYGGNTTLTFGDAHGAQAVFSATARGGPPEGDMSMPRPTRN